MNCPVCKDVTLIISSREGIEIDHCPQCRGVWLDRGELDKIIERSAAVVAAPPPVAPPPDPRYEQSYRPGYDRDDRGDRHYKRKKKRSFLDDIFDFD